jgi:tetratricopeptide (TPR) repeat protein
MRPLKTFSVSLLLLLPANLALADLTALPRAYYEHGLVEDAKRGFIGITFDEDATEEEKARALSELGSIAFDQNKIGLAISTWRELTERFPESAEAMLVAERLDQIGEIVETTASGSLDNQIAMSHLRNGDWWSRGREEGITIDSSWIPNDQAALQWYDRVISEFPDTPSETLALKRKFQTVYGWEEPGQYGETYGVKKTGQVQNLIDVFTELETGAPEDVDLQRFRYMVAQSFWAHQKFDETRTWLQKVIDADEGKGGFYADLAAWRLKKVEY